MSLHETRIQSRHSLIRFRIASKVILLIILGIIKYTSGSGLCNKDTLVGTQETGHYRFIPLDSPVLDQDALTSSRTETTQHSYLRNQSDTLESSISFEEFNETLQLRIGSYNIRAAFPEDRGSDCSHPFGWEARVDQVAEQIDYYHPAIIGLQEDTHYQIKQLKPYLPNYRYVGVNRDDCEEFPEEAQSLPNPFGVTEYNGDCEASKDPASLVHGGEFNSIWYRPDIVELQSWGVFWLGSSTAVPGSHFYRSTCELGGFGPSCDVGRIVTWASFRPIGWPHDFYVFNTHVTSNQEGNQKSPEALIRKIKDIAGGKLSYALGDYATPQFSETYDQYRGFLNDPDNPHPGEPQAQRQWPEEANNDFRRGGRVDPPHGTFGPYVNSSSLVYDFIWGHHVTIFSILNDRLRDTSEEEWRRLRSDHRMLLATVELKPEHFVQNGKQVQYPLNLESSSSAIPLWNGIVVAVMVTCISFLLH